jgi:hypothetical protein
MQETELMPLKGTHMLKQKFTRFHEQNKTMKSDNEYDSNHTHESHVLKHVVLLCSVMLYPLHHRMKHFALL